MSFSNRSSSQRSGHKSSSSRSEQQSRRGRSYSHSSPKFEESTTDARTSHQASPIGSPWHDMDNMNRQGRKRSPECPRRTGSSGASYCCTDRSCSPRRPRGKARSGPCCQCPADWSDVSDTQPTDDSSSEVLQFQSNTKSTKRGASKPHGNKGGKFMTTFDYSDDDTSFVGMTSENNSFDNGEPLNDEGKDKLCEYIFHNMVGYDHIFKGPYGNNSVTYLDFIASGKPLKCIEKYIRSHVMPTYANTHTEVSHTAQQTTLFREEARNIIRESVNASDEDCVIFTGSGATSAINKLIWALHLKDPPIVFIGPYEHHSNILPWLEARAKVVRIPQTKDGLIDLHRLHWEIQRRYCMKGRHLIGSFSAASNITGIMTDVNSITAIMHKFGGVAFFDYACAAPYVDIDMNPETESGPAGLLYKDAIFISPHKFIGGPGTPGILIAKRYLFVSQVPHITGGGTVNFVRRKSHRYMVDPEHREEGGTPAIIESIRAGLVFKLKETLTGQFIMDKEEELYRKVRQVWSQTPDLVILGNQNVVRLPVFPLIFYNKPTGRFVHQNFIATILNDVFGIQVRSSCSCAGPYSMDLLGMGEETAEKLQSLIAIPPSVTPTDKKPKEPFTHNGFKPGFVRLNIPYFISKNCLHFVLKAVNMVAQNGWSLLPQYEFDKDTGTWANKKVKKLQLDNKEHLESVQFGPHGMNVKKEPRAANPENMVEFGNNVFYQETEGAVQYGELSGSSGEVYGLNYAEALHRAEGIFADALKGIADERDQTQEYTGDAETLRWFMLPSEAANIIHNRTVTHLPLNDLPFLPGALARKLGVGIEEHKGRSISLDKRFPVEF